MKDTSEKSPMCERKRDILFPHEIKVLQILEKEPLPINALHRYFDMGINRFREILNEMIWKDLIKRLTMDSGVVIYAQTEVGHNQIVKKEKLLYPSDKDYTPPKAGG